MTAPSTDVKIDEDLGDRDEVRHGHEGSKTMMELATALDKAWLANDKLEDLMTHRVHRPLRTFSEKAFRTDDHRAAFGKWLEKEWKSSYLYGVISTAPFQEEIKWVVDLYDKTIDPKATGEDVVKELEKDLDSDLMLLIR